MVVPSVIGHNMPPRTRIHTHTHAPKTRTHPLLLQGVVHYDFFDNISYEISVAPYGDFEGDMTSEPYTHNHIADQLEDTLGSIGGGSVVDEFDFEGTPAAMYV